MHFEGSAYMQADKAKGRGNSPQVDGSGRKIDADQDASHEAASGENSRHKKQDQLWSPMFVLLIGFTLCCFIVGQGLNSGCSVYLARYGDGAAYAGLLAAVFSVAAGVTRLVSGPIIDSRGRRAVMLVGTVVLVIGTFMPSVNHEGAAFIIARLLQGAGFSAATTAAATAAADVLPKSRMGEGIGFYGLGQAIAMSIGPALALALVSSDPAENLFYGLSASAAIALALALACRYEKHPELLPKQAVYRLRVQLGELGPSHSDASDTAPRAADESSPASPDRGKGNDSRSTSDSSSDRTGRDDKESSGGEHASLLSRVFEKRALPGAIPQLVLCPAFGFGIFFIGLYGTKLGCGNAGLFYTVSALSMIVVRIRSASLMDKTPPLHLMGMAVGAGVIAYLILLACGVLLQQGAALDVVFCLAGIPYGFCLGISMPLNQSIAVKNTPPHRWGAANALFQLAIDCGIGLSCLAWGTLNDVMGFSFTICCVMAMILLSLLAAKLSYAKAEL